MTDDVAEVLRTGDRFRPPTENELERIRQRVLGEPAAPDVDVALDTQAAPTLLRRPGWIAMAAAICVLAGIGWLGLRSADEVDVSTVPPPPTVCAVEIPAVVDALDAWRTVEAWARVGVAEPDLGGALLAALDALESTPEAVAAHAMLSDVLQRSQNDPGQFVTARIDAARGAADVLLVALASFDDPVTCDLGVIERELG